MAVSCGVLLGPRQKHAQEKQLVVQESNCDLEALALNPNHCLLSDRGIWRCIQCFDVCNASSLLLKDVLSSLCVAQKHSVRLTAPVHVDSWQVAHGNKVLTSHALIFVDGVTYCVKWSVWWLQDQTSWSHV